MGCTSTTTTAKNDDGGIAAFPQITYTMGSENLTYVYRVTEVKDSDTSTSSGMGYDDAVYYVLVKNQQVDNESGTGRCLSSTGHVLEGRRHAADGRQRIHSVQEHLHGDPGDVGAIRVQKTFTGRAWETSDTFDFTLTPRMTPRRKRLKTRSYPKDGHGARTWGYCC